MYAKYSINMADSTILEWLAKFGHNINPVMLPLIDQLANEGYDPDFIFNSQCIVCFESNTYKRTIIKIKQGCVAGSENMTYYVEIVYPKYSTEYCCCWEKIISMFNDHGILQKIPIIPTKGVFDESSQP